MTSVISGSSVWTETSGANDRSSRRALILQMAKARMKQSKSHVEDKTNVPIVEESFEENPRFDKTEAANSEDVEEEMELDWDCVSIIVSKTPYVRVVHYLLTSLFFPLCFFSD